MKTAIVTGGTKKDIDAMAVLAINIKKKSPAVADEMIIFHDGVDAYTMKVMQKIMPIKFIKYKCPISSIHLWANRTIRYFSPMIFCKYECFRLLEEYDTVIWTDYDILIKYDIQEIRNIDNSMAFTVLKEQKLRKMFYKTVVNADMHLFDLDGESITMPLFVLKRTCGNYRKYYEWCIYMTRKYCKYLYLPEQCIVTMLVQYFDLTYTELSLNVYCMHPREEKENTKILHSYGQPKFWNGLYNEEWQKYYQEWIEMKRGIPRLT